MSDCLTYVIISLLWLCMLSYAWMRERFQKKNIKKIGQENQMLELTFNFPRALPILTFYENELNLFNEKNKETKSKRKTKKREKKKKRRKRKIEVKWGERKGKTK